MFLMVAALAVVATACDLQWRLREQTFSKYVVHSMCCMILKYLFNSDQGVKWILITYGPPAIHSKGAVSTALRHNCSKQ
jgi:hypothetical protein